MQKVAAHVNEFHRDADSMNRVLEIQKDVHGLVRSHPLLLFTIECTYVFEQPFSLVASSRKFIFEQAATIKTLEEPHWSTRNLYLFSGILITKLRGKEEQKIIRRTIDSTDILLYAKPPSKFSKKTTYVGSVELDHVVLSESKLHVSFSSLLCSPSSLLFSYLFIYIAAL